MPVKDKLSSQIDNIHVISFKPLMTPKAVHKKLGSSRKVKERIVRYRNEFRANLWGQDNRLVLVVGPCSIHDTSAGLEYARRLADLKKKVNDKFQIIMRVYFEKPRTTIGWKGFINDPHLDGTNDIELGLLKARQFLLDIAELDLPAGTEFLDPIVPQYISDLICWSAIGARTTESQTHRELASGLSMPVGFKNATNGSLQVAMNAMISSRHPHSFLGLNEDAVTSVVNTSGNQDLHVILRGGSSGPNYRPADIKLAKELLKTKKNERNIMVDCSHGNCNKDFRKQVEVFWQVMAQVADKENAILGFMLESFIEESSQDLGIANPLFGRSITDACIDWATTETLIMEAYRQL